MFMYLSTIGRRTHSISNSCLDSVWREEKETGNLGVRAEFCFNDKVLELGEAEIIFLLVDMST